jgi:hypothetical protein
MVRRMASITEADGFQVTRMSHVRKLFRRRALRTKGLGLREWVRLVSDRGPA